jgi:N-acyl-D-amino-acid deacylase
MAEFDIVIHGGTVVDGSADAKAATADIGIVGGRIAEVGRITSRAKRSIDADGLLVTPGFVDIHTHYDGQVSWDPLLSPSFHNGVTSVIMGNCGVGFAPVRKTDHDRLIKLMEGVEEIPGTALHDGMTWDWESFPEYLDALDKRAHAIDIGGLLAHGALRTYVMGDRAGHQLVADTADNREMARLTREAMDAGAFGVSSSRSLFHRSTTGELVPGTYAEEDELVAIGQAVRESGHGAFEIVPMGAGGDNFGNHMNEIKLLKRLAQRSGVEVIFTLLQYNERPDAWREILDLVEDAHKEGIRLKPGVFGRGVGVLFSFQSTNPFSRFPSYAPLAKMSYEDRNRALRDPAIRAAILADHDPNKDEWARLSLNPWPETYFLRDGGDYEPTADQSIEAIAKREGRPAKEVGYDLMLQNEGRAFLHFPFIGYTHGDLGAVGEMLEHPLTVISGSDAGAHCSTICDGAMPTFMLAHWTRDRTRGPKLPLEWMVHKQTRHTAMTMNMPDRGLLRPGMIADINLIDYKNLKLLLPEYVNDLPSGAGRLVQRATGYVKTFKSGVVISEQGVDTGARPGRILRSAPQKRVAAA